MVIGIGSAANRAHRPIERAWPLRAILSSRSGKPVGFRALNLGGRLIFQKGLAIAALSRTDTLHATTPADYALDLRSGAVMFLADGQDSLQVVIGGNPFGSVHPVRANGRRFVVRLVADTVVIDHR